MKPVRQFWVFELLWGFEGRTWDKTVVARYYGITVPFLFFGFQTLTTRKDSHGSQRQSK